MLYVTVRGSVLVSYVALLLWMGVASRAYTQRGSAEGSTGAKCV